MIIHGPLVLFEITGKKKIWNTVLLADFNIYKPQSNYICFKNKACLFETD